MQQSKKFVGVTANVGSRTAKHIDRSLCTLSTSTIPAAPLRYFPQNLINLALCEIYYYLSLILSITIGSRNSQPGT